MLRRELRFFIADEAGVGSIWALLWLVLLMGIGGLGVDMSSAYRTRTMLQATADAAALAGAISLPVNPSGDNTEAVAEAVSMAERNMAATVNGIVLTPSEVSVGTWDRASRTMSVPQAGYPDAVMVTARRDTVNQNPVPLTFLKILSISGVDFTSWNVQAQAVAERFVPECIRRQGLIARGVVNLQSNNLLSGDICVHAEDHVEVNNNNVFAYEEGVTVSMPRKEDIVVPNWAHNPGLAEALRSERLDPRMVDHVQEIIDTLRNPLLDDRDRRTDIVPAFITDRSVVELGRADFDPAPLFVPTLDDDGPGRIDHVQCYGNQQITLDLTSGQRRNLPGPLVLKDFALVTSCRINLGKGIVLANVVLASNGGNDALTNANIDFGEGDVLGAPDDCLEGGGVHVFSTGDVRSPAKLTLHGAQIVAAGDVSIAAQAEGLNGVNIQAGGDIDIASNNALGAFGACAGTAPDLLTVDYYRLVL